MIEKDNKLKDFIEKASEKFKGLYDYSHVTRFRKYRILVQLITRLHFKHK